MIGTALRLDNPDALPVTQLPQNFAYGTLLFPIENLAPVFRSKDNMIFTISTGVR